VRKLDSTISTYSDGDARNVQTSGARRTCIYTTDAGKTLTVTLSSGAQVLAFVDAEDAAMSKAGTSYGGGSVVPATVVTAFGPGNDAWAIKGGGSLSALYKSVALVITAPHASVHQLENLASKTLGIPYAVDNGV
jgi:hypothetical protein